MAMTAKEDLLSYFENVLGVRGVITPLEKPLLLLQGELPASAEESELFQKMLASVGLVISQTSSTEGQHCLRLVSSVGTDSENTLQLLSPRQLLKDPGQKRLAWEQLKKLKELLAASSI